MKTDHKLTLTHEQAEALRELVAGLGIGPAANGDLIDKEMLHRKGEETVRAAWIACGLDPKDYKGGGNS